MLLLLHSLHFFSLTHHPGVGNFPQPKTRQKAGRGERYAAASGQPDPRWARAHVSGRNQLISHEPGKGAGALQTPEAIAGSVWPLPRGRSRCGAALLRVRWERSARHLGAPRGRQGEKLSAGFETSCATKPVQIANTPTVQLCPLLMMKMEQNMKCLQPYPSSW